MGALQLIKLLVRRKEDKTSGDHFRGIQKNRLKPSLHFLYLTKTKWKVCVKALPEMSITKDLNIFFPVYFLIFTVY